MFFNKNSFGFVAFIAITCFLGSSNVQANMGPLPGGYPQHAGSYAAPQQQMAVQPSGYNQYMQQPDPYQQYAHAHAHQQQPQGSYGSYNMQQPSYNQQYMQNTPVQQWQSFGNPYMNNLGQYGSQQMQQPGYPYSSYMQQDTGASYMQQAAGSYGNLANLLSDFGKPQANKSQMPNVNVYNVGAKKKN